MSELAFKSWSASRLDDYTLCPFMAKHKHLLKTCTICFRGVLKGPFGEDPVCTVCGKTPEKGAPLVRGSEVGLTLENYVKGTAGKLHKEIVNPLVKKLAKSLRAAFSKGKVEVEKMHKFERTWGYLPGDGWHPKAWLFVKMDVCHDTSEKVVKVIDWKTGGVDRQKQIRVESKYDDQLLSYKVASLILRPRAERAESVLCFVDAAGDPLVDRGPLLRKDLKKAQDKLVKLSLPLMTDRVFAPRPNEKCRYCAFSKEKGGPCKF